MFMRVGTPVLIDEVVTFTPEKAEVVKCHCGTTLGLRSSRLFKAAGADKIVTPGTPVQCISCGETTNV